MSYGIPDDPIIRCLERTGYPPWMLNPDTADYEDDDYFAETDEFEEEGVDE